MRNVALLVIAVIGLAASVAGTSDSSVGAGLVAAAGGAVVGLLAIHLDDLVDLFAVSPAQDRVAR